MWASMPWSWRLRFSAAASIRRRRSCACLLAMGSSCLAAARGPDQLLLDIDTPVTAASCQLDGTAGISTATRLTCGSPGGRGHRPRRGRYAVAVDLLLVDPTGAVKGRADERWGHRSVRADHRRWFTALTEQRTPASSLALHRARARHRFDRPRARLVRGRSEEHTSELQSRGHIVCRLLLEKKK